MFALAGEELMGDAGGGEQAAREVTSKKKEERSLRMWKKDVMFPTLSRIDY
jgi:hypothetical protein